MDIEDLKSVWKKANDQGEPGYWISKEDVRKMAESKSELTINLVSKALKGKLMFLSISLMGAIFGISVYKLDVLDYTESYFGDWLSLNSVGNMIIFMGVVILIALIQAVVSYREIRSLASASPSIKEALNRVQTIMDSVVKTGIYSDTIGVPIMYLWVMSIYLYGATGFVFDIKLLYLILPAGILSMLSYMKNKRFMQRKFGHFIIAINESLDELKGTESE